MNQKNKSSVPQSLRFIFRRTAAHDKKIFFYSFLSIPFQVLDRLADIYLIALIVDAATHHEEERLLLILLVFALYQLLSGLMMRFTEWQLSTRNYRSKMKFLSRYAARYMRTEFTTIESTAGKDLAQRAKNAMAGVDYRDKSSVETAFLQCAGLIGSICGLFVYTGIISLLDPLILLLLLTTSAAGYLLQRAMVKYDQKDKRRYIPLDRKLWYLVKELRDPLSAKDIRLYGLMGWLRRLFGETLASRRKLHAKRSRLQYGVLVLINLINTLFTGYIYYYLIRQYLAGGIDISQFLLYFGLITGFNGWLMSVIDGIEALHMTLLNIDDLRRFDALPQPSEAEAPPAEQTTDGGIRFEHVSFGYQEGTNVISDMSFTVAPGEKIAIVGLNGAGKTTLVKLLCGLYTPKEGCILLGGRDLRTLGREELFRRFAVVFQDIYLLPTSIERNITLSEQGDGDRLSEVLALSGLQEKISSLPDREQTLLVKGVLEDAVELSGGEIQKLALARALYKGGEIFVLDEPTAKLDPIAEQEMYLRYGELTKGKTSVFISHRLSSTRFCDRIFYLENGVITECGTHDELLRLGGAYARLFETQSRYYREEGEVR
ncbi:MAG: ABC transporter ATP-binding protein [Oscillospiraceae bacterium]|nr:ABC transporter ATP-binding protein [Oscillospiraceae bacterium]